MAINRWDPFGDLTAMRDTMDRLFRDSFSSSGDRETWWPRMDVTEDDNAYHVRLAVPGVKPEDVDVRVEQQVLTVRGELRPDEAREGRRTLHSEHAYGRFTRSITLPGAVDTAKATAQFEHGILTITLPKSEEARPRVIPIGQAGAAQGRVFEGQTAGSEKGGKQKEAAQAGPGAQEVPVRS